MHNSVVESVARHAEESPGTLCLADRSRKLTYLETWLHIVGVARQLGERGVAKGDYVVIECNQGTEFVIALLAVQLIGAVAVPLEKGASPSRRAGIADKIDATLFIGPKESLEFGEGSFISYASLFDGGNPSPDEWFGGFPTGNSDSEIMFSTGTTGIPKGVVLTHDSDMNMSRNIIEGLQMKANTVEFVLVPLNHAFGFRRVNANLVNGSSIVISNGALAMKQNFDLMNEHHANAMALSCNTLSVVFKLSGDRLGEYADALDYVQLSSALLPEQDKARLMRLLPRTRLYNFYGSTEAGATCLYDFNAMADKPHCIGTPIGDSRFIVVDAERQEIESSPENMGILASSSNTEMRCYLDDPELTNETMANGFVYTKDLGYIDDEGFVYILGRADDVINFGGVKVAPEEIENAVDSYAALADCACVGMSSELSGQIPVLCIVLAEGADYDEKDFKRFIADQLGPNERPQRIVVVDEIPRTYNGKIRRHELVELLRQNMEER